MEQLLAEKKNVLDIVTRELAKNPSWAVPLLESIAKDIVPTFYRIERQRLDTSLERLQAAEVVVRYCPDSLDDLMAFAGLLSEVGRFEESLDVVERVIRSLASVPSHILLFKADLLERVGRPLEAVDASYAAEISNKNIQIVESPAHRERVARSKNWAKTFQSVEHLASEWERKYWAEREHGLDLEAEARSIHATLLKDSRRRSHFIAQTEVNRTVVEAELRDQIRNLGASVQKDLEKLERGAQDRELRANLLSEKLDARLQLKEEHVKDFVAQLQSQCDSNGHRLQTLIEMIGVQSQKLTELMEISKISWRTKIVSLLSGKVSSVQAARPMYELTGDMPSETALLKPTFAVCTEAAQLDSASLLQPASSKNEANEDCSVMSNKTGPFETSYVLPDCNTSDDLLSVPLTKFVEAVYHTLLGRAPDVEGASYYNNSLRFGKSKEAVIAELGTSSEASQFGALIPGISHLIARQRRRSNWLVRRFRGFFNVDSEVRQLRVDAYLICARLDQLTYEMCQLRSRHDAENQKFSQVAADIEAKKLTRTAEMVLRQLV